MLVDQLRAAFVLEQDTELIDGSHDALQPYAVRQEDRQQRPVLPDSPEEGTWRFRAGSVVIVYPQDAPTIVMLARGCRSRLTYMRYATLPR